MQRDQRNFTVNNATFSPDGLTINTQFEQRCDAANAPALIGTFTFGARLQSGRRVYYRTAADLLTLLEEAEAAGASRRG